MYFSDKPPNPHAPHGREASDDTDTPTVAPTVFDQVVVTDGATVFARRHARAGVAAANATYADAVAAVVSD